MVPCWGAKIQRKEKMSKRSKTSIHIGKLQKSIDDAKAYWHGQGDPTVVLALPRVRDDSVLPEVALEVRMASSFQELDLITSTLEKNTVVVLGTTEPNRRPEVTSLVRELMNNLQSQENRGAGIALENVFDTLSKRLGTNPVQSLEGTANKPSYARMHGTLGLHAEEGMRFGEMECYMSVMEYAHDRAWVIACKQHAKMMRRTDGKASRAAMKVTKATKNTLLQAMLDVLALGDFDMRTETGSSNAQKALKAWKPDKANTVFDADILNAFDENDPQSERGGSAKESVTSEREKQFAETVFRLIERAMSDAGETHDPAAVKRHAKDGLESLTEKVIENFLAKQNGLDWERPRASGNTGKLDVLLSHYRRGGRTDAVIEQLVDMIRHPREDLLRQLGPTLD